MELGALKTNTCSVFYKLSSINQSVVEQGPVIKNFNFNYMVKYHKIKNFVQGQSSNTPMM